MRMKEYFDLHNKSGNDRTDRSLQSKWSFISSDCQKWAVMHPKCIHFSNHFAT